MTLWLIVGIWAGCLLLDATDDFRGMRGLVRAMRRQARWVRHLVAR